jgi:hypothetical protein
MPNVPDDVTAAVGQIQEVMTAVRATGPVADLPEAYTLGWVRARAECLPRNAYARLMQSMRHDVEIRNELHPDGDERLFKLVEHDDSFSVFPTGRAGIDVVRIDLRPTHIGISHDNGSIDLLVTPRLSAAGACIFEVDGAELEEWQLRRKALESLFFLT